ncbi:hypothetical protein P152DRAFT_477564 [Eremomyces bilateralis CBS 781.70]|uniref:RTA1-domain-containing protein n=1 Tax=Eremomyces bilateralis CBS 781.70 TaxID=1392243 RepID=A0A6G1FQZ0_9PEZI|nr:uncharacterized protein P152DRAFT_477564 [Eremomyces bilateralis CBS 781.70]KAF1808166.1 hypothetical protein P152DRAFT_477564 [Eremomyces bilateralis CBS 781.70]
MASESAVPAGMPPGMPPGMMPGGMSAGGLPPGFGAGPINPFMYKPNVPGNVIGTAVFGLITITAVFQCIKYRSWYFHLWAQASLITTVALSIRTFAAIHLGEMEPYIIYSIAVGIPPTMIAIGLFMTFTRIIWFVAPDECITIRHLWLPSDWVTFLLGLMFAAAEIIRAAGGKLHLDNIVLLAVWIQWITLACFVVLATRFLIESESWACYPDRKQWRKLLVAVEASALILMFRATHSIVTVQELKNPMASQNKHEWIFWVFDVLPTLAVYIIQAIWHPGQYLPRWLTTFIFRKKLVVAERRIRARGTGFNISPPMPADPKSFEVTFAEVELGTVRNAYNGRRPHAVRAY